MLALSPRRNAGARCGHAAAADLIHCGLGSPRAGRRKRLTTETPSSFFFSFSSSLYLSVAPALRPFYMRTALLHCLQRPTRESSLIKEKREREAPSFSAFVFILLSVSLSPSLFFLRLRRYSFRSDTESAITFYLQPAKPSLPPLSPSFSHSGLFLSAVSHTLTSAPSSLFVAPRPTRVCHCCA